MEGTLGDNEPVESIELKNNTSRKYSRSRSIGISRRLSSTAKNDTAISDQEENLSIVDVFNEFGDFVSASGLPRACKKDNGAFKRLFYGLIFIVSFSLGLFFATELIGDYLDYPKIVNIEINTKVSSDFPSLTICNTNRIRESAIQEARDSSLAYLLDIGRIFNGLYYEPCLDGDHWCSAENLCLRKFKVCDGYRDCSDQSDEASGCYYGKCGSLQHRCPSGGEIGVCMEKSFVCNGHPECYDSSDEQNCNTVENCQGFLCNSSLTYEWTCLASSSVCDTVYDCADGSDELIGCEMFEEEAGVITCFGEYSWQCADRSTCIFPSWICDGLKDCPDGSDETFEHAKCPTPPVPTQSSSRNDVTVSSTTSEKNSINDNVTVSTTTSEKNSINDNVTVSSTTSEKNSINGSLTKDDGIILESSTFSPPLSSTSEFDYSNQPIYTEGDYPEEDYQEDDPVAPAKREIDSFEIETINGEEYIVCDGGGTVLPIYYLCDAIKDCYDGTDEKDCDNGGLLPGEDPVAGDDPAAPINSMLDDLFKSGWSEPYHTITQENDIYESFEAFYRDQYNTGFERVPDTNPPSWDEFVTFSNTGDFSDLENVLELTLEETQEYGHQASDMIIQCSFDQTVCSSEDFYQYQDDKYGNCYTFNHPEKKNPSYIATGSGPSHGLKLTLFTEQDEYVSIYGQDSGIISVVHPRGERPFPESSGILASPGKATFIGIKQTKITRLPQPYGNCTQTDKSEFSGSYTLNSCRLKCLQDYINSKCGCIDTILLNDIPRCHFLNHTQEQCRQLMYYLQYQNKIDCSECKEPCSEIIYSKTTSSSEWPSQKFMDHIIRSVHTANEKTRDINDNYTAWRNLARVEVYFEDLNFQEIIEKPKFNGPWDLMSQVGGIIGLYIGLSIITVVEFFELVYMLFIFAFKKMLGLGHLKKRTSPNV